MNPRLGRRVARPAADGRRARSALGVPLGLARASEPASALVDPLDRAHADALVEPDRRRVLALHLELDARGAAGLEGLERESQERFAEAMAPPRLVYDDVLHEAARPADRRRREVVTDLDQEARGGIELTVA